MLHWLIVSHRNPNAESIVLLDYQANSLVQQLYVDLAPNVLRACNSGNRRTRMHHFHVPNSALRLCQRKPFVRIRVHIDSPL